MQENKLGEGNNVDTIAKSDKAASAAKLFAVKGMNDILPLGAAPASQAIGSQHWEWLESEIRRHLQAYGYHNVRTPVVEPTALFERGTGQTTDIVEKEMYAFTDRMNGDELCLRPENTPGVVRAAIEHNLTYNGGQRVYYMGPMFRHERPQRGRYRQFHQLGAEALGFAGPQLDAELMIMAHRLLTSLGLSRIRVEMNSLGIPAERQAHREALIAYFSAHHDVLDEDARRRLHTNPLRILDTKNPALQSVVQAAPQLLDYLGLASKQHFETVQNLLSSAGMPWSVNPRLVRGLDYYSHTVFEFVSDELGAQGTICGGGRYDGLFEILGGKPTPAVGWALGIERLLDLLHTQNRLPSLASLDAYVVVGEAAFLPRITPFIESWRAQGLCLLVHAPTGADSVGMGSLKSQFKKADTSGARYALVFGQEEVENQQVTLKPLRGQGEQKRCALEEVPRLIGLTNAAKAHDC